MLVHALVTKDFLQCRMDYEMEGNFGKIHASIWQFLVQPGMSKTFSWIGTSIDLLLALYDMILEFIIEHKSKAPERLGRTIIYM